MHFCIQQFFFFQYSNLTFYPWDFNFFIRGRKLLATLSKNANDYNVFVSFGFQERSTHERRPEEIPSIYTTTRPAENSKHGVASATSDLLARSGFQPYRPEHHPAHAPPAFALDPAAYSPYHHGLYPPPHLQHAYRSVDPTRASISKSFRTVDILVIIFFLISFFFLLCVTG